MKKQLQGIAIFCQQNIGYAFLFMAIFMVCLWAYHRIRYRNSGYGKFEYYAIGETNEFTQGLLGFTELMVKIAAVIAFVLAGAWFIKYIGMYL